MYGAGTGTAAAGVGAGALAYTGAPLAYLVGLAAAFVIGGIVLFRIARRKHRDA